MTTETSNASSTTDRTELSPTDIFPLLSHERRRYVMYYLDRKVGAVPIGDVAEQIALWEDDLSKDRFERIVTGLYHTHLPTLGEAGVVRYDLARETVERTSSADSLTPYLEVALRDDLG